MNNIYTTRAEQLRTVGIARYESINQIQKHEKLSEKYNFISTKQAIEVFQDLGWSPVAVRESNTRKKENQGFQKHMIRFHNENLFSSKDLQVKSTIPQIILTNSHLGSSSFVITQGLLEKVCSNGLIVWKDGKEALKVRHSGKYQVDIEDAIKFMNYELQETLGVVDRWKNVEMSRGEQLAFSEAAIDLRWDGDAYSVEPSHVLQVRHYEQKAPTLYNTFNVVQENVIKGGVKVLNKDSRDRRRAKEVGSLDENVRLNKALWKLTAKMAELKGM